MKKTIKLTFAALALTALASCSGDDLLGNGNNPLGQNKKNLTVEVEDLVDQVTTRAALNSDGETVWQTGDLIRVYDDALTKYDKYSWTGNTYESVESQNVIKAPKYALFDPTSSAKIKEFGWDYETKESYVVYTINQSWDWAEDETSAADGAIAYLSNLPMWGTVEEKENGGLKSDLKFLTSVIKINLTNIKNNVQSITVEAYEDAGGTKPAQMWGDFKAVLENIEGTIEGAALVSAEDAKGKNSITVSLYDEETGYKTKKAQSILYIPIIARTYGKLEVSYTNGTGEKVVARTIDSGATFNVGRSRTITIDNFTFKNAGDIPTINEALAAAVEQTGDVVVETENKTEVKAGENEIIIPKGMATKSITLDLQGLTATSNQQLKITAEEGEYSGTLYVKVPVEYDEDGEMATTSKVSEYIKNVYVNMPNADVVFQGTWTYTLSAGTASGVTFGVAPSASGDDTKAAANTLVTKTLTFGEGTTVLNVYPNAESGLNNETGADIMVAEGAKVNGTLKLKNSTKIDNIVVNGYVKTLTANAKTAEGAPIVTEVTWGRDGEIGTLSTNQQTISLTKNNGTIGSLTMSDGGNVTVNNTTLATLSIPAIEGKELGLLTVNGAEGKVTTANVQGANVTVSVTKAGQQAITNLTLGKGNKLTLTGGYIGTIKAGTNLTIVNNENYNTSITTIAGGVTYADYTSRWCGKSDAKPTTPTKVYRSSGVSTGGYAGTDFDYVITTASQFAFWAGATSGGVKLGADINLYNKEFTPAAAVSVEFDGNNKTVSNVTITKTATAKEEGVGLFKSVAADVKNLLIKNITIDATSDGANKYPYVGALAGKATSGTITDVNVEGAALTSDNFIVGGLIGEIAASSSVTISGRTDKNEAFGDDKFSTVAGSVTGLNKLGGLVGQITSGTVEIKNYKSSVELTETEEPTKDNVRDFGTVAPFVGTAVAGQLTAKEGLTVATPLTFAARLGHNFDSNIDFKGGVYYYFVGRDELGYVSGTSFTLIRKNGNNDQTINTLTTTVDNATNIANTNALNVYLKYDKYED